MSLSDDVSRSALALINGGSDTIEGAQAQLDSENINIVAGDDACSSEAGQAAILTAVTTSTRAVGRVHVDLADPTQTIRVGPYRGRGLGGTLSTAFGAHLRTPAEGPTLVIGTKTVADTSAPVLTVTWDGWTAAVRPDGARLAETGNQILAPIAAAALAVYEAWAYHRGRPDGARRNVTLSLWDPTSDGSDPGPTVGWVPNAWQLVGLGHLGQAYAWNIAHLPYNFTHLMDPTNPYVLLQDFDVVTTANRSTGVLLQAADIGHLKTRVTAPRLEAAGFTTRIVERRLTENLRRDRNEPSLALIGVDNLDARRAISSVGWDLAVDVGLGGGTTSYTGISVHTITAKQRSDDISAWRPRADTSMTSEEDILSAPAYQRAKADGHDICGLVQLAGRSVAASFVGVVAACIAVAEPLRLLAGRDSIGIAAYDLRGLSRRRITSALPETVILPSAAARVS